MDVNSVGGPQTWQWYYWVLIGVGAFIVLFAVCLLAILPKHTNISPDEIIKNESDFNNEPIEEHVIKEDNDKKKLKAESTVNKYSDWR